MIGGRRRHAWRPSSRLWPFGGGTQSNLAVVDLGAHKIACALLSLRPSRIDAHPEAKDAKVLGYAVGRSMGFSNGEIVNVLAVETSLRRVVAKVEAQAGITVENVTITGSFLGLSSQIFEAHLANGLSSWTEADFEAMNAAAEEHCTAGHRKLLHVFARGMARGAFDDFQDNDNSSQNGSNAFYDGDEPTTDVIAVSMPLRGARQIAACLKRSLLQPKDYIAGPLAAALAVTTAHERQNGVLVIDMGARCTGCALFYAGAPAFVEMIPIGGHHITEDIAKEFCLKIFEAERLKIRHSGVLDGLQADIDLPYLNGETGDPISKFALHRLVRERATFIFKAVNERLKDYGYSAVDVNVVLTGGGSLLHGIQDLASHVLAADARIGQIMSFSGLNGDTTFSTLVGACAYACRHQSRAEMADSIVFAPQGSGYAARISQWLRASF